MRSTSVYRNAPSLRNLKMIVDALFYYLKFDAVFENLPKLGSEFCAHVAVLRVGFFVSAASFMNFKLTVDVLYNFLKFDAVFGKISKLGSEWSCVRDIFGLHVGFFGSAAGAISWWAVLKIVHKYAALFGQMTRKVAKYVAVFYKTSKLGAECYCARDFFGLHAWFFVIAAGGISRWAVLNKIHKFAAVIGKMTRKGIKFWFKAAGFGFFTKWWKMFV